MTRAEFHPTEYDGLNDVLYAFVQGLKSVLDDRLVAAYLQGSFALRAGDLFSDVDFLVVVEDDPNTALKDALQAMHRRIYAMEHPLAQHLEGSYFPRAEVRRASADPMALWYLDNGSRTLERSTHDNDRVVRWVTREHGITLTGPPPHTLIDPVAPADLRAEIDMVMQQWGSEIISGAYPLNSLWSHTFVVIMYCRMLQTRATGAIHSKPSAVEWALRHVDARWHALIKRSWAARDKQQQQHPPVAADAEQARVFVRLCLNDKNNIMQQ